MAARRAIGEDIYEEFDHDDGGKTGGELKAEGK